MASMRPRSIERGNDMFFISLNATSVRFNEAAFN